MKKICCTVESSLNELYATAKRWCASCNKDLMTAIFVCVLLASVEEKKRGSMQPASKPTAQRKKTELDD